jgi:hypothetical protein
VTSGNRELGDRRLLFFVKKGRELDMAAKMLYAGGWKIAREVFVLSQQEEGMLMPTSLDRFGFPAKLGVKEKSLGPWKFLACGQPIIMRPEEIEQLNDLIYHWRKAFAGGVRRTLIQKYRQKHHQKHLKKEDLGVHSIVIRADYFWKPQYGVQLCEIEERPAGFAVMCEVNAQFRPRFIRVLGMAEREFEKPLAFCISSDRRHDSDDVAFVEHYRWLGDTETGFHPKNIKIFYGLPSSGELENHIWWVRALRTEESYFDLEPRALSTISQEGDKEYGIPMGLWFKIEANWRSVLPLELGCVLKPRHGSRLECSFIVKTSNHKVGATNDKPSAGIHGLAAARRAIESGVVAYWQPFYPPERVPFLVSPDYGLLRRACFGFNFETGQFEPLGGVWVIHNTARIHGASNALFGPLQLPV